MSFQDAWSVVRTVLDWLPLGLGWLVLFMCFDIASALMRAAVTGEVLSKRLSFGAMIKLGSLVAVFVAFVLDDTVGRFYPRAKQIPVNLGAVVAAWFTLSECISILENLHCMGVPLPSFLVRVLKVAKKHLEGSLPLREIHVHKAHVEVNTGGVTTTSDTTTTTDSTRQTAKPEPPTPVEIIVKNIETEPNK